MKNFIKSIFSGWTPFEMCLLFSGIIVTALSAIIFGSDWVTPIASICGIIDAMLLAKGKVISKFTEIGTIILYSIVSFNQRYYGEVITYLFINSPICIYGICSWLKNRDKKTNIVIVNEISKKEWLILVCSSIGVFVGFYFMLRAFNTANLLVSTISMVVYCYAMYLNSRRSKYGFVFYVFYDIILIVLWSIPIVQGTLILIPMVVNPIINLANDSYGVVNFSKLKKQQASSIKEDGSIA